MKEDIKIIAEELQHAGIEKPSIYVTNVDEKDLSISDAGIAEAVKISAKLEAELSELEPTERKDYLEELGIEQTSLERIIKRCYELLDLVTFFTIAGGKQVQAWPVKKGTSALDAAGIVHTDMQKGFIKAEVIPWNKLLESGNWKLAAEKGMIRLEGRDYKISDGDVVEFKFFA